jgi:4-hydroxyphenylpyruvate dioxygenase-like putative hemolysin
MDDPHATLSIPIASHVNDALNAIQRAEAALRAEVQPCREAVQHELVSASVSLGRVLALVGGE